MEGSIKRTGDVGTIDNEIKSASVYLLGEEKMGTIDNDIIFFIICGIVQDNQ